MAQAFLDYLTVYVAGYLFVLSAILDWTGQSLLTAQVYELRNLAVIKCSIFLINVRYLSPCGFTILCGRGEGETLDRDRIMKVRRPAGMKNGSPHGYW